MQCSLDGTCSYETLPVSQLKQILNQNRIDYSHCVEKVTWILIHDLTLQADLVELVNKNPPKNGPPTITIHIVSDTMCP